MSTEDPGGLHRSFGRTALGLAATTVSLWSVLRIGLKVALGGIFVCHESLAVPRWLRLAVRVDGLGISSTEQVAHLIAAIDRCCMGLAFLVTGAVPWAADGLTQKPFLERMGSPPIRLCLYVAEARPSRRSPPLP